MVTSNNQGFAWIWVNLRQAHSWLECPAFHSNRLKGDIVEALQCVKCSIRHDLLFREPGPSSSTEEFDGFEIEMDPNEKPSKGDDEEEGWEALFLDEDEDDVELDFEID